MVISRRERYLGIAVALVLGAVALDSVLIEPLLANRRDLDSQLASQKRELARTQRLFGDASRMNREWSRMAAAGLKHSQSEAESQLVHGITEWAQDAGLTLPTQQAGRTEKEKDFNRMTFRATGTGGMSQISRFLYRIETATIPVRVTDLTISSRKDGTDDLSLALGISTIYPAPESPRGSSAPPAPQPQDRGETQ